VDKAGATIAATSAFFDHVVTQSGAALNNRKNQVDTVVVPSLLPNAEYLDFLHKHLRWMMTKTALHPNNMENGDILIQIVQGRTSRFGCYSVTRAIHAQLPPPPSHGARVYVRRFGFKV
jgi:hypothetical protein